MLREKVRMTHTTKNKDNKISRARLNSIRAKQLREERRRNRLCTYCGKPVDRPGVLCSNCLTYLNNYNKESKEAYIAAGICPLCHKNEIFNEERSCPECRAKRAIAGQKRQQQKIDRNREVYNERIEKGLCPRCGKPKEDDGRSWCADCRAKRSKWNKKKGGKNIRSEWSSQGYCVSCGKPERVPGKKLCEDCYRSSLAGNKKAIANRPKDFNKTWKESNMRMRGRFRRLPVE